MYLLYVGWYLHVFPYQIVRLSIIEGTHRNNLHTFIMYLLIGWLVVSIPGLLEPGSREVEGADWVSTRQQGRPEKARQPVQPRIGPGVAAAKRAGREDLLPGCCRTLVDYLIR